MSLRSFLQKILTNPVLRISARYSSRPDAKLVYDALSKLYTDVKGGSKRGLVLQHTQNDRYIIFSDHHKGAKNGADDFMVCEQTYIHALQYYAEGSFRYICLGDCEELWENNLTQVKSCNEVSIQMEKEFVNRGAFYKVFGNHDLFWDQDPFAAMQLKSMFGTAISIYEGIIIQAKTAGKDIDIFLTHGHQGDKQSDGNWFSKFFVARVWGPLQAYLRINPNTPAYSSQLKTTHNTMMYEWSSRQNDLLLITGHTHQPVFQSLTLLESLVKRLDAAKALHNEAAIAELEAEIRRRQVELPVAPNLYDKILPTYFNSGCCCFSDGDITGIELEDGTIRLVKWKQENGSVVRTILEEQKLEALFVPAISV